MTDKSYWNLLPLYLVVFLLEAAMFYPGVINPDAVDMMLQGTVWPYHTWHSVPFAWVWQLLQKIVKGPALMFFLINSGFLGGLLVFVGSTIRGYGWQCAATFVVAFNPCTVAMVSGVGKDSATTALLTIAAAALVRVYVSERARMAYAIVAAVSVIFAGCIRPDALIFPIPIIFMVAWRLMAQANARGRVQRAAVAAGVSLAIAAVSMLVMAALVAALQAEKRYPVQVSMGWDLTGIALQTGDRVYPDWLQRSAPDAAILREVYSEFDSTRMYWGPDGHRLPATERAAEVVSLFRSWALAIAGHPVTFLRIRANYAAYLLGIRPQPESFVFGWSSPGPDYLADPDAYRARFIKSRFLHIVEHGVRLASRTPLMQVWFYGLLLVLALGGALLGYRGIPRWVAAIAASGLLQIVLMIFLSASAQLRYLYWAVTAGLLVTVAVLCEQLRKKGLRGMLFWTGR